MPSTEYRHMRSGSLNIHSPQNGQPAPMMGPMPSAAAASRFDGPRSPPNTSHVPCKFFRQGACQAGNACPFSHDLGASAETVCKYFAKGNCKFGPKCANIHILPDGRRINYGKNGVTIGTNPIALGGRANAPPNHAPYQPTTTSALTSGLYRDGMPAYASAFPYADERQHHLGRQPSIENGLPTIDTPYSHPGSNYGSPRDEDTSRLSFGLSPVNAKGLSVLDAPLPASFDSQGISNAARYPAGPWPASVPSQFGLDSPSPSLNNAKDGRTSDTLKILHHSVFGGNEYPATSNNGTSNNSPPNQTGGEEYFGRRTMHSSRYAKPKMMSSSLPKATVDRDWDAEFAFLEEDYVPHNLQDLLTPAEKARRGSIRAADAEPMAETGTKFGSPIAAASPSRWGPLFQKQKDEDQESGRNSLSKHAGSAFGHVGSPLRNSVLSHSLGADGSGSGRPIPSHRPGGDSTSALTQQFQRTRLADDSPRLHPMMATGRTPNGSGISAVGKEREKVIERHVSSGSIGSSGRFTTPIDEEDSQFLFNMEEDENDSSTVRQRKRVSSGLSMATTYSYAGVLSSKNPPAGSNLARDAREPDTSLGSVSGR